MIAEELINQMIPPLKLTDDASKAITWMVELRTNQLPVIEKGDFLGFISEEIIFTHNNKDENISSFELIAKECKVYQHQHFYDVVKVAADYHIQMVAVLDEGNHFIGVISVEDTLTAFAQSAAVQNPGGILVISMRQIDYSLAEISRLIESDDAKILSSCIVTDILDPSKIKLTLKINRIDLSRTMATLERFGYRIIAHFQETQIISNEKERLDILLKYLDI